MENGLAETILEVERNVEQKLFETPQTVSWERVSNKLPRIFYDLIEVVEMEKGVFHDAGTTQSENEPPIFSCF